MGLEILIERLERADISYSITGDGRTSTLIVDGKVAGTICDDIVHLYN